MAKPINLVLLYGGKSGEHEISLISAASILAHLDPEKYHIIPVGIDKEGCFFVNDYEALRAYPESLPVRTPHSRKLDSLICNGNLALNADVVFPIVHGPIYEDGCLQGLLEHAGIAYVGCGVLSSAIGMDKDIARRLVCVDGLQSTPYRCLSARGHDENLNDICQSIVAELGWPLFVKPCSLGSSVGTHKVHTMSELLDAISDAKRYDLEVLIEAFASGREIELAVLENPIPNALPKVSIPGEIIVSHPDGFYSYTSKYLDSTQTQLEIPAKLPDDIVLRLQQFAAEIFTRMKCRGMARVDFFVDEKNGKILFSEINTIPGFTMVSMYPKLWAQSGLAFPALLDQLIELAIAHRQYRDKLVTHYN